MTNARTTLGELITLFYDEYVGIYGDRDLASLATAASINEILVEEAEAANRGDPPAMAEADAA